MASVHSDCGARCVSVEAVTEPWVEVRLVEGMSVVVVVHVLGQLRM